MEDTDLFGIGKFNFAAKHIKLENVTVEWKINKEEMKISFDFTLSKKIINNLNKLNIRLLSITLINKEYLDLTCINQTKLCILETSIPSIGYSVKVLKNNEKILFHYTAEFKSLIIGSHFNQLNKQIWNNYTYIIDLKGPALSDIFPIRYGQYKVNYKNQDITVDFSQKECTWICIKYKDKSSHNIRKDNFPVQINIISNKHFLFEDGIDFFNELLEIVQNILYLCIGSCASLIERKATSIENTNISFITTTHAKYNKNHSGWASVYSYPQSINFDNVYYYYEKYFLKNTIPIYCFTNAFYSKDLYGMLKATLFLQCLDGYMTNNHKKNKFTSDTKRIITEAINNALDTIDYTKLQLNNTTSEQIKKSINSLIGRIDENPFKFYIQEAINLNEYTNFIFEYEQQNQLFNNFLKKAVQTRNQFSHMYPQKYIFCETGRTSEAAIYFWKINALLRILFMSDLDIRINKSSLEEDINRINKYYLN